MPIRRLTQDDRPLADEVAAILLTGWGAHPPSGRGAGFTAELLDLFSGDDALIAAHWRAHEAYLRRLAQQWGAVPLWGDGSRRYFFGEHVALSAAMQRT
ncbi:MAG TPA: hypothetical protein VNJ03_16980 [Vicinamibacterales bacterium]|nr:hypothetical protein [Vicinamibacterales bacterium]